ncbi:methylenetetrahydrofolate reductase [Desertivirga brevis]|uniref:methylenetetrahydrofolate reductase n=1 Tax=Desertivirga brevis TaxID=2810310 RepID=UPI001A971E30|nr:methylenetetrahydrofolate reductase [Pedobacter sp. SYSU D00873]
MFNSKIEKRQSGILLYGITPPKANNTTEKIEEITKRTIARVQELDIDGLVIYDLQDEATRNPAERPFPFFQTIDAFTYANEWFRDSNLSKIVYCSVGKLNEDELTRQVQNGSDMNATVFVGAPSKDHHVQLSLDKAYKIWKDYDPSSLLGAVAIPERHYVKKNEHLRIANKMQSGCSFFITQCVYNVEYVKNLISDLYFSSQQTGTEIPTLIFTLTPCGSVKTLKFLDWLGIHVPEWLVNELTYSNNILSRSVDLCIQIAREIIDYCLEKNIPFGLNIESVSIRKEEIEASGLLLKSVAKMLEEKGVRSKLEKGLIA